MVRMYILIRHFNVYDGDLEKPRWPTSIKTQPLRNRVSKTYDTRPKYSDPDNSENFRQAMEGQVGVSQVAGLVSASASMLKPRWRRVAQHTTTTRNIIGGCFFHSRSQSASQRQCR